MNSNQTKMKNKLIELVDGLREELSPNAYIKIKNAVQSLNSEEPELLPFQWPVPGGMEVVTSDGRKVEQLVKFNKVEKYPIAGLVEGQKNIYTWTLDGRSVISRIPSNDLFLRPIERKLWVVEWPSPINNGSKEMKAYYPKTSAEIHSVKYPTASLYEAALKPIMR